MPSTPLSVWKNQLLQPTDIAPLAVFRVFFGLLMMSECLGALLTGWVSEIMVIPTYTFTFLGFGWTRVLLGPTMYGYYVLMAFLGLAIALGYYYRIVSVLFTVMWALAYWMQKSHYNNHYYLIVLIAFLMCIVPAHQSISLDAKQGRTQISDHCPYWCVAIFKWQVLIVYFYAAVAKLYPGWLNGEAVKALLSSKYNYPLIGTLLQKHNFHLFLAYSGILFDFLIVPALMLKKTRTLAVLASLVFHIFNSVVFKIGVFPYFALSFAIFYYPDFQIRRFFIRKPALVNTAPIKTTNWVFPLLAAYFALQLILPIRHWFIKDNVLWTEEGHRLSWRMMLRTKSADFSMEVRDAKTKVIIPVLVSNHLQNNQIGTLQTHPDCLWQFAQYLEKEMGKDIEVYYDCKISVNGSSFYPYTNKNMDITAVKWNYYGHQSWILPKPKGIK